MAQIAPLQDPNVEFLTFALERLTLKSSTAVTGVKEPSVKSAPVSTAKKGGNPF